MKKYLVVMGNNEQIEGNLCRGVEHGVELAKLSGASVHIVAFSYETYIPEQTKQKNMGDFRRAVIMTQEKKIATMLKELDVEEVQITSEVVWEKNIADWLINEAKSDQYSVIIKSGHRTEKLTHTPTDWQLFRESPIPVMIIDKNKFKPQAKILCALDLGSRNNSHKLLNRQIIRQGKALAVLFNSELSCCYAIPLPKVLVGLDLVDPKKAKDKRVKKAKKRFVKLAERFEIEESALVTKTGDAETVVPQIANQLKAEMVVIGTLRRQGIKGKLIGNTAEKVLHNLHKDLLVVSPTE